MTYVFEQAFQVIFSNTDGQPCDKYCTILTVTEPYCKIFDFALIK
jgi:hypothetical protein